MHILATYFLSHSATPSHILSPSPTNRLLSLIYFFHSPISGEEGVYNVLKLLNEELILAMKLAGCVSLTDLKPSLIRTALSFQSRL